MAEKIILKMEQLTVGYGKKAVIRDIMLEVEQGKIMTLIGPNGSGKSTILKSITKQLQPLGGCVYLTDQDMKSMKDSDVAKTMAMVMTERLKPELMTCRDVVATGRYPYTGRFGILSKEDWKAVDEAMELVRATETAQQLFTEISDGQKQRVMLARAICQEPQVLVLDEPTSYLDMRYKIDILQNIRNMAREKKMAVIMSLHELDLAQKIADTIACVKGEYVDRLGTPEEIFQGEYIQQLYGIGEDCFDPLTGSIYLEGNKEQPRVFVISGGGNGIAAYYQLQRKNIPFAVGILAENDVEYGVAKATASEVFASPAFYPVEEDVFQQACQKIEQCEACVCTVQEFGPYNEKNQKLMEYARSLGKLVDMKNLEKDECEESVLP